MNKVNCRLAYQPLFWKWARGPPPSSLFSGRTERVAEIVPRWMEHFANPYCKFVLNKAFIQKSNGTHITRVTTFPLCLEIYGTGVTATRTLANYSCRKRTPFLVTLCNVRRALPPPPPPPPLRDTWVNFWPGMYSLPLWPPNPLKCILRILVTFEHLCIHLVKALTWVFLQWNDTCFRSLITRNLLHP